VSRVSETVLDKRLRTMDDAMNYLNLSRRSVYELIYKGQLKAYRVGRGIRFRQVDLDSVVVPFVKNGES